MKQFLPIFFFCFIILSCKKENTLENIHNNSFPRMVMWINVDSITGAELDTIAVYDYFKQSNIIDYDSISIKYPNQGISYVYKIAKNGNNFEMLLDSAYADILYYDLLRHKGAFMKHENNISNIFSFYSLCGSSGDPASYLANFELRYDTLNRISNYNYVTISTHCAVDGITSTSVDYTYSINEDSCFINYYGDYFGCQEQDTIIYYDDYNRSNIPYLAFTYPTYSECTLRFSHGKDFFPYSTHYYKLIKEVRTRIGYKNSMDNSPLTIVYSDYKFDEHDNVKEVNVKLTSTVSIYNLNNCKIKFFY